MGFRMKHKFSIILEFWFGQFICSIRNSVLNLSQIYSMLPLYVLITNLQCADAIGTYHKFKVCCRYMYLSQIYSVLTLYVLITNLHCADAICSYYKFTVCWRYMYFSQIYSAQPLYVLITNLQCADAICTYHKFTVCWRYMFLLQIYSVPCDREWSGWAPAGEEESQISDAWDPYLWLYKGDIGFSRIKW